MYFSCLSFSSASVYFHLFHSHNHHLSPNSPRLMFLFVKCATVNKVYLILSYLILAMAARVTRHVASCDIILNRLVCEQYYQVVILITICFSYAHRHYYVNWRYHSSNNYHKVPRRVTISNKTFYRNISHSLGLARLDVKYSFRLFGAYPIPEPTQTFCQ